VRLLAFAIFLLPQLVLAHAQLLSAQEQAALGISNSPIPRVDSDSVKDTSPCGAVDTGKAAPTQTYTEGSTIEVHWKETINHTGVFRFDLSTDNDQTFTNLLANDIVDGNDAGVSRAAPKRYVTQIQLPAGVTCDNCTLRMTQSMGAIDDNDDYFSCSDIRIVAATTTPPPTDNTPTTPTPSSDSGSSNQASSTETNKGLAKMDGSFLGCGLIGGGGSGPGPAGGLLLLPLALLILIRRQNFSQSAKV
jgi:hypothetical protein